nr:hypothetical protein [Gammaproteobacteria bacterium]
MAGRNPFRGIAMIDVERVVSWSPTERTTYEEIETSEIHVAATDLPRAVRFYSRVFGFEAVRSFAGGAAVAMRIAPGKSLVIHDAGSAVRQGVRHLRRWGFVVNDLDTVRQLVWELGVAVARDSGAADHIYRWASGRSLYIRAPDGVEIELVEIGGEADVRAARAARRVV